MSAPQFWRMGATPVPVAEIARIAREHEAAGWDGLAVGEAHGLLPDPYVTLALAAAATTTLGVGTAVAVPLRSPLLAADAMATVQAVSGGRASFSVGRGDGAMKVLRRAPMRVAEFEEYLRQLQGFLARAEVETEDGVLSLARLDDIDPSLACPRPPVNVAATGPRTIALAARWADGVSFSVGADPQRLGRCIQLAREACREAGRGGDALELGCYIQVAVGEGAELDAAREAARGLIMTHSRFSAFEGRALEDVRSGDEGTIAQTLGAMESVLRSSRGGAARTTGGAPGELDFYPRDTLDREFIDRFAVVGSAQACAERIRAILDLGIRRVYIGTRGVGIDLAETNALRIGRELLPLLRG